MSRTANEIIRAARSAGLPASVLQAEIPAVLINDVYHSRGRYCHAVGFRSSTSNLSKVKISELESKKSCECIAGDVGTLWGSWSLPWQGQVVSGVYLVTELVPQMDRLKERFRTGKGRRPAVGLTTKLVEESTRTHALIDGLRTTHRRELGAEGSEVLEELCSQLKTAVAELRKASRGGRHQETLLARIQKELLPANWEGEAPELESDNLLVSIAPPMHGGSRAVGEVISTFTSAETAEGVLMQMPRYVYNYLQRKMPTSAWHSTSLQAVPDPGDEVVDTLAGVWNPTDSGPLRDLKRAVEAAQILHPGG